MDGLRASGFRPAGTVTAEGEAVRVEENGSRAAEGGRPSVEEVAADMHGAGGRPSVGEVARSGDRATAREDAGAAKGGRPTVLDETKRAEICALLAAGCSFRTAANYVGCDVSTISKLKGRDEAFRLRVERAIAEREVVPLAQLQKASKRSWRAAIWLLERTVGGRFRRGGGEEPMDLVREVEEEEAREATGKASGGAGVKYTR